MADGLAVNEHIHPRVMEVVRRYWGFDTLRPLQAQAIQAGVDSRDSLVVLPTGGGKSLCYQVPPIVADRMDIVVSPLIALMKDQVDGLRQNGYPAAAVHSNITPAERQSLRESVRSGECRLLFVAPERLLTHQFLDFLGRRNIRSFAIDEAHCISQWGHDFRPEYRKLAMLRERFPDASLHAYTATATTRVQHDIVAQLGLREPRIIVGRFDRPNLVYRVVPMTDVYAQTLEIVRRHANEAAIVYCLSRKDSEAMAIFLQANGVKAAHYHAGMEKPDRTAVQDDFAAERIDVVTATVAFGMGIDRSNVRCVVHATMPKSIEHYQQETGRAGRDGLEAECVLLYSGSDVMRWGNLIKKSAENAQQPEEVIAAQFELLNHMQSLCSTLECRHRALSRYFGQGYENPDCGACDVCLGEVESMDDSTTIAQKILSCVYRLNQNYGVGYVCEVLRGASTAQVRQRGHDQLSTYGILREHDDRALMNIVYQLVDQGFLERIDVETRDGRKVPVLHLTEDARSVLSRKRQVKLVQPGGGPVRKAAVAEVSWEGVDEELFEHLRELRKEVAAERGVPAFVIFGDAVLRDMARLRPSSLDTMRAVSGVGERKLADLGPRFTDAVRSFCERHGRTMDVNTIVRPKTTKTNPIKNLAMQMLAEGATVEEVMRKTGRAASTIWGYICEYIERDAPERIDTWVPAKHYDRIAEAAATVKGEGLRAMYDHLNGEMPYEHIRAVLMHRQAR